MPDFKELPELENLGPAEAKEKLDSIYPKNGQVEDMRDIPAQEVKRHDGLPTMDDVKKMFGKPEVKGCGEEEELGNFIELIIKIRK